MSIGQGKLLSKHKTRAYLGWSIENFKLSNVTIFLSFIAILCAKMSCVTWAYTVSIEEIGK